MPTGMAMLIEHDGKRIIFVEYNHDDSICIKPDLKKKLTLAYPVKTYANIMLIS